MKASPGTPGPAAEVRAGLEEARLGARGDLGATAASGSSGGGSRCPRLSLLLGT